LDEFVALPSGASLQGVAARHAGAAVVYLRTQYVFDAALNAARNESVAWRAAAKEAGGGAAAMLRVLRGYSLRAGPGAAKRHPLGQVKALVDPNRVDQVRGGGWARGS
jgi:hypothetical protein